MKRLTIDTANLLARKFRADCGISASEAVNIKSLLRKLNIFTVYRPLSENFYGMSLKSPSGAMFMLINSESRKGRQHYTIAHELYHLFIEENPTPHICKVEGKSVSEKNADMFASAFLMPEEGILEFIKESEIASKRLTIGTVLKLEQYFSVSHSALVYRLSNSKIISAAQCRELLAISPINIASQYGHDTALYEKANEGLIIGDLGEKARFLYDQERISEGHYNEIINLISNGK